MKVILTDDVVGVGDIGEAVSVKSGYARNFLIPQGLAIEAEAASAKAIAHRMQQIEAKKNRLKNLAERRATELAQYTVELGLRVGSGGKVFGSINSRHIAEHLTEKGFEIDRRRIQLGEPIKRIGSREVNVKLHAEVIVPITVHIAALAATKEEEEQETQAAKEELEAAAESRLAELGDDGEETIEALPVVEDEALEQPEDSTE